MKKKNESATPAGKCRISIKCFALQKIPLNNLKKFKIINYQNELLRHGLLMNLILNYQQ